MAGILRQPRASLDSNGPSTIDRLEESAARLSISSRPDQDLRQHIPSRHSSARSTISNSRHASSTHSSLRPAPLNFNGAESRNIPQHATTPYSAGGVVSPLESLRSSRSFSWSQASGRPSRTNSRIVHSKPLQEPEQEGRPLDSMLSRTNTTNSKSGTISSHRTPFPRLDVAYPEPGEAHKSTIEATSSQLAPTRSASTASRASTIQTTRSLFRDFDGTHYTNLAGDIAEEDEDDEPEDEGSSLLKPDEDDEGFDEVVEDSSAAPQHVDSDHEMSFITFEKRMSHDDDEQPEELFQRQLPEQYVYPRPQSWAVPPPDEHMVYYPAPVPMNLNLPKRLSRQSPAVVQAQRRSQILGAMGADARRSVPWLSAEEPVPEATEPTSPGNKRKTVNLQKLPPQLRASVFFDPLPVSHDIEIHQGSAVLSLERMLDASAQTPVGVPATASTLRAQKSRSSMFNDGQQALRKSRSSVMLGQHKSTEFFSPPKSPGFDRSTSGLTMYADGGEKVDEDSLDQKLADGLPDASKISRGNDDEDYVHIDNGLGTDDPQANEHGELNEEQETVFSSMRPSAPTTLLAELQLRKEEQKSRKRTAAPAYHTGMQSTLLELDAVAQIERRRRGNKPTQLAWEGPEDPSSKARHDDDDTPLGLLFPARGALINKIGEHGVGLMEQRAIDDNEPLSRRRDRLLGVEASPQPQHERNQSRGSVPIIGVFPTEPVEEETLAQRTRRLRSSRILDEAIGMDSGRHVRSVSDDFASEMMSQLGVEASPVQGSGAKTPDPEETLGQRRRRLQAERQASGIMDKSGAPPERPVVRPSVSLSNILAASPAGTVRMNNTSNARLGQSGLLGASDVELAARRQHIADRNLRSTSHAGFGGPLIDASYHHNQPGISRSMSPAFQQALARKSSAMSLGMQSHGSGMHIPQPYPHQPQQWSNNVGYGVSNGAPTMSPFMQPGYAFAPNPQTQYWQQQMYPTMVPPLNINTNVTPSMGLDHREGGMSPEQRTNIDLWRQSVMQ